MSKYYMKIFLKCHVIDFSTKKKEKKKDYVKQIPNSKKGEHTIFFHRPPQVMLFQSLKANIICNWRTICPYPKLLLSFKRVKFKVEVWPWVDKAWWNITSYGFTRVNEVISGQLIERRIHEYKGLSYIYETIESIMSHVFPLLNSISLKSSV